MVGHQSLKCSMSHRICGSLNVLNQKRQVCHIQHQQTFFLHDPTLGQPWNFTFKKNRKIINICWFSPVRGPQLKCPPHKHNISRPTTCLPVKPAYYLDKGAFIQTPNPLSSLLSCPVKTLASARRTVMSSTNYLWQDQSAELHQFYFLFGHWTLSDCIASLSRWKHEPKQPSFNLTVFGENWPPSFGPGVKWRDHTVPSI